MAASPRNDRAAMNHPTPQQVADAMHARDHAARALDINIVAVNLGGASVSMVVRQDMVNGHDICHGGYMALLCDTAFAYACNSYNLNAVARGFSIEILAPAKLGDTLLAVGVEQAQRGRQGVYDIKLSNQNNEVIALFRGKSARIAGEVISTSTEK